MAHLARGRDDNRRKARFLGDRDYPYGSPLSPPRLVALRRPRQPSAPAHGQDDAALEYYNEEAKDDNDDIVATLFYDWQMAMEERREFQLSNNMTEEEISRIAVLVSEGRMRLRFCPSTPRSCRHASQKKKPSNGRCGTWPRTHRRSTSAVQSMGCAGRSTSTTGSTNICSAGC
jgi:predicted RNA-binding protein with PUA-like domain